MSKQQKEFIFAGKTYQIEDGIDRPGIYPHVPWKTLYKTMKVGESVLLTRKEATNFVCSINAWIVNGKAKTGRVSMRKVDEEHARVWKIK